MLIIHFQVLSRKLLLSIEVAHYNFHMVYVGVQTFSRLHPLACWFGSMMLCFAGGILGNFLLGEPLLTPLNNETAVLTATIVW